MQRQRALGKRRRPPCIWHAKFVSKTGKRPLCVDFVLNNGTTPDKPLIDSTLGGVALLDFDNDGFLDIFFTNGARIPTLEKDDSSFFNRLYRNNRDRTFTDVTERAGLQGEVFHGSRCGRLRQ